MRLTQLSILSVIVAACAMQATAATSLPLAIDNPSFEDGLSGWIPNNVAWNVYNYTAPTLTPTDGANIAFSNGAPGDNLITVVRQELVPGDYQIMVDVAALPGNTPQPYQGYVQAYLVGGGVSSELVGSVPVSDVPSGGWKTAQMDFNIAPGSANLVEGRRIHLILWGQGIQTIYDNVRGTLVPGSKRPVMIYNSSFETSTIGWNCTGAQYTHPYTAPGLTPTDGVTATFSHDTGGVIYQQLPQQLQAGRYTFKVDVGNPTATPDPTPLFGRLRVDLVGGGIAPSSVGQAEVSSVPDGGWATITVSFDVPRGSADLVDGRRIQVNLDTYGVQTVYDNIRGEVQLAPVTLTGTVTMENTRAALNTLPLSVSLLDAGGTEIGSATGNPSVNGAYSINVDCGEANPAWAILGSRHRLSVKSAFVEGTPFNATLINGDADNNGQVNLFDFVALDSKFGSSDSNADLDDDGWVNLFDYVIIDTSFGAASSL